MTADRIGVVGLLALALVGWVAAGVANSRLHDAQQTLKYTDEQRQFSEDDAWKEHARAESCERLLKMKEMP